jgi:asparagine N-glycosylation enzyme membrane subunit Stt3
MSKWIETVKKLNNTNVILSLFVITAFALRLLPWNSIIIDWGKAFTFIQPDAYYQMRRSMIWATNFPNLITMDYYMANPFGAECPWSPLYNFTLAVLTLIFSGSKANQQVLQLITALLPPIIAALCIIPVYKIVKTA